MNVSFATFKMIVKVVPEEMDQVNGVIPGLFVCMTRKEYKCDVSHSLSSSGTRILKSSWWLSENN